MLKFRFSERVFFFLFIIFCKNYGPLLFSGAVGGKTGKTLVLPRFSKIEGGGGSSGAPECYGGLTSPGHACHDSCAADFHFRTM